MPTDPRTADAVNCDDCGLIPFASSDPRDLLRLLPVKRGHRGLFNDTAPDPPTNLGARFNDETIVGTAIVGIVPGEEPTPQYEIARIFTEEKDQFLHALKEARTDQIGLGIMTAAGGRVRGDGYHATGKALNRIGEQFGVGRPTGFTDCCYWRLVQLLFWVTGPTRWRLAEIAALYTGRRPAIFEEPGIIQLQWPSPRSRSFWGHRSFWRTGTAWWRGDDEPAGIGGLPGFWSHKTYWRRRPRVAPGLTLEQALELVKPAGVVVRLQNLPRLGRAGCYGATRRGGTASHRGAWA